LLNAINTFIQQGNITSVPIVFNIDNNNKSFLSCKSTYHNDFWRIMWHWRVMMLKNLVFHYSN